MFDHGNDEYRRPGKPAQKVDYLSLELAAGGELFDIVSMTGYFPEPLARYYYKQLLSGLHHVH